MKNDRDDTPGSRLKTLEGRKKPSKGISKAFGPVLPVLHQLNRHSPKRLCANATKHEGRKERKSGRKEWKSGRVEEDVKSPGG